MAFSVDPRPQLLTQRQKSKIYSSLSLVELVKIISKNYDQKEIRRKPLPQGFCYVCSRLDPEGRFGRHPHSYLFNKGFFRHCEHVPKTPFPTVIIDSNRHSPTNSEPSRDMTGLSVQIKVTKPQPSPGSPEHYGKKYFEPPEHYGKKYFDTSVLNGLHLETRSDSAKYRVPAMFDTRQSQSVSPGILSGLVPLPTPDSGRRILQTSDRTFAEAEKFEERWIDFSDGDDSNDDNLDWGETELGKDSIIVSDDVKFPPIIGNEEDVKALPIIDSSLERINASIDRLEGRPPRKRPMAGKLRKIESDDEDESSHLKYHHRIENDNVPVVGFELPPSRETLDSRHSKTSSESQMEMEVDLKPKSSRRSSESSSMMLTETPSMIIARINNSAHWCECKDIDPSQIKCPECYLVGGHEKWCIYARSTSNEGFPCPQCGKPIKRNTIKGQAGHKTSRTSRQSFSTRSSDSAKQRFGTNDEETRRVRFEDELNSREKEDHEQELERLRAQSESDEDFMNDVQEIIHDKDRYSKLWTPTSDQQPESSSGPWPKVDPDIHRKAYLKALLTVSLNRVKKMEEIDENYYANRLRRPHVFSYFKLRPRQKEANIAAGGPLQLGIKPVNGPLPTTKKAMKHIFGKLNVGDFYPGGKNNPHPFTMSLQEEDKKQTMPVHGLRHSKS